MTIMKVWKDKGGNIINIGEWDYQIRREPLTTDVYDKDTGETFKQPVYDQLECGGIVERTRQVFGNPVPEGAYEDEADIVAGADGGLYDINDPRRSNKDNG